MICNLKKPTIIGYKKQPPHFLPVVSVLQAAATGGLPTGRLHPMSAGSKERQFSSQRQGSLYRFAHRSDPIHVGRASQTPRRKRELHHNPHAR